jgi:hypothetical protein
MLRYAYCWGFLALLLIGCAEKDTQERFRVSGKVTYDNQPVNFGEVLFTPDATQGNSGAQGIATITNGRYDTVGSRAPGVAAGPVVVRVTALSDANGKLLTEYEFKMDIQKTDNTKDIEIPSKDAPQAPATPEI